jgi:hypothetical protein
MLLGSGTWPVRQADNLTTIPTERPPLLGEVSDKFADRRYHVVSVTDPYCRILGFLDRSRY